MADRELENYEAEKRKERERQARPAKTRDEKGANADVRRGVDRAGHRDVPPDAEGQAERGRVDQVITNKNWTQTQ